MGCKQTSLKLQPGPSSYADEPEEEQSVEIKEPVVVLTASPEPMQIPESEHRVVDDEDLEGIGHSRGVRRNPAVARVRNKNRD